MPKQPEPTFYVLPVFVFVSAYSFDGLIVFGLLVICTCAYMRRVPKLKQWFLSDKKGFMGIFYKGGYIHTLYGMKNGVSFV